MKELRGMPAAKAILADLQVRVDGLKEKGMVGLGLLQNKDGEYL